jgi:hypothetical protein
MRFGREDLFVTAANPHQDPVLGYQDEDQFNDLDETEVRDILDEARSETVYGIVTSGPFAGPFVVEIVKYTSMHMRTKYFWNGHSMPRKELYLCGKTLPCGRVALILRALTQGVQFENSTVPMIVIDLLSNRRVEENDIMGEATMAYFNK